MKEFMMIFVGADYDEANLSPEEVQQRLQKWDKWVTELRQEDLFIDGRALKNKTTAVSEGQVVTDGAFVETKELVSGYFLLKARDMDHMLEISKDFPEYDIGGQVHIREMENFEDYQ